MYWKQIAESDVLLHNKTWLRTFLMREGYAVYETFTTLMGVRDYGGYLYKTLQDGRLQCALDNNNALAQLFTEVIHPLLLKTGMPPSAAVLNGTSFTPEFLDWLHTRYTPQDLQPTF